MPGVQEALDTLRTALHRKGVESHMQDAFNDLTSCLVFLNSSSPSVQMIRKLCTMLRQPLLLLYNVCLRPTLQLSSSVLSIVLGKLCDAQNVEEKSLREAWDETAGVILSGILDFLDQKDTNVELESAVWEALLRIICEFFFLDSGGGLPVFTVQLCLSAYNTLTEIAVRQITIRNALRQKAIFGGERLGAAISGTRDYLLLEALLMLFARLLPPIHNGSGGNFRRIKFVKEVLGSQKLFKRSTELLEIMRKSSGIHWDDVAAQIIDVLARTDITYPQPFSIDEIDVCGCVFPQPLATDRLIMDKQAFFANIVGENDDLCESLQVPYSHIRTITLDSSGENIPKGKVLITVYLTSPPLVANVQMKSPDASHLYAKFLLQNDAMGRFMEALRRRGVGKLSFLNPPMRVERKRKNISIGSGLKFINGSSPSPPTTSFEGKVEHVSQVYRTDIEEPTAFETDPMSHTDSVPTPDPKPPCKDEELGLEAIDPAVTHNVPATLKSIRSSLSTKEMLKPIRNFTLPFSHEDSTGTVQSLLDNDELSEISEFEPDNNTTDERVAAKASVSCIRDSNPSKPTLHKLDGVRTNKGYSATSKGIKKSSCPSPKIAERPEEVSQGPPETGKPLLTLDSPIFGSSSSTQIGVSPKLSSNVDTRLATPVITEFIGDLPAASQNFIDADKLKRVGVGECGPSDAEFIIASAGEPHIRISSAGDERRQRTRHPIEITKGTGDPPKISGSRRKRESTKSSSKAIIEIDDECTPPRKKCRSGRVAEDKVKYNVTPIDSIPISRVKGFAKTVKLASPSIAVTTVDFDELPEPRPTCQGTRRSTRIKKKETATARGGRTNAMRSKARKGKSADGQSTCVERKELAAVSLQDTSVKITDVTPSVLSSHPLLPVIDELPFPKTSSQAMNSEPHILSDRIFATSQPPVKLRIAQNITPEKSPRQGILKANSIIIDEPSQHSVMLAKEGNFDSVQQAALDTTQPALKQFHIHTKTEEIPDNQQLVFDLRSVDDKISQVLVSSKEDPGELSRLTVELAPQTETTTIDLTIDDSPARKGSELLEVPVVSLEPITIEEPTFVPSPRRRSVAFASPIEYVLEKKVKSKTRISSSSRQPWSPPESNSLFPLKISTVNANRGPQSPDQNTPPQTLQKPKLLHAHYQSAEEAGIQDIVEVLNEIQAVITKGISDTLRNVKRDVRRGRDELIQQVLNELQGMVVESATYFNGLLRLEEDYYENAKAITYCWEELIDCNDAVAVQIRDVLKEHDQSISARAFPKSLLPFQPVFPRRCVNA